MLTLPTHTHSRFKERDDENIIKIHDKWEYRSQNITDMKEFPTCKWQYHETALEQKL